MTRSPWRPTFIAALLLLLMLILFFIFGLWANWHFRGSLPQKIETNLVELRDIEFLPQWRQAQREDGQVGEVDMRPVDRIIPRQGYFGVTVSWIVVFKREESKP